MGYDLILSVKTFKQKKAFTCLGLKHDARRKQCSKSNYRTLRDSKCLKSNLKDLLNNSTILTKSSGKFNPKMRLIFLSGSISWIVKAEVIPFTNMNMDTK